MKRITQSFIKTMRDYKAGNECGLLVKHQYIDGNLIDRQSKAMAEGSYFEFLLSGALPKNGIEPKPVMMKSGKDMMQEYRRAKVNADRVMNFLTKMGLKIVKFGWKVTKGKFEGTIDLICECQKEFDFGNGIKWQIEDRIVIDVKYSGLIYNRWEKMGWEWSDIQKEYHGTQAIQYHFLTGLPFYFLVVSNTNKEEDGTFAATDVKLFHTPIDQDMIERHLTEANKLEEELKFDAEMGFVARPSMKRCGECPLFETCTEKHEWPHPEVIDLTIGV